MKKGEQEPRERRPEEARKPKAGNAVYDAREQTHREDVEPDDRAAEGRGQPMRGSEPPRSEGRPVIPRNDERREQGT